MERLNMFFFYELSWKGSMHVIEWCMKEKLIVSQYECPQCHEPMRLVPRMDVSDGFEWKCVKAEDNHNHNKSIRAGSWFAKSNLRLHEVLMLTYMWLMKAPTEFIENELYVTSKTVTEWFDLCREMCINVVVVDSVPLGGKGEVVEMFVSEFGKQDYNTEKRVKDKRVICGFEIGSKSTFFKAVPIVSKDTLLDVLRTFIKPGTTVASDCWKSYHCLEDTEFKNVADSLSLSFKNHEKGACISSLGGTWSAIFRQLPRCYSEEQYDSYLAEYMWRRSQEGKTPTQKLRNFLQAISKVYPVTND